MIATALRRIYCPRAFFIRVILACIALPVALMYGTLAAHQAKGRHGARFNKLRSASGQGI